jgi:hypothetical protein
MEIFSVESMKGLPTCAPVARCGLSIRKANPDGVGVMLVRSHTVSTQTTYPLALVRDCLALQSLERIHAEGENVKRMSPSAG